MSIDWAITNANVTPTSGTVIFEVGDTTKSVQITAGEVGPTEVGQLTLSNQINLDGGDPPILEVPFIATFTVVDIDETTLLTEDFSSSSWYSKWHNSSWVYNPTRVNSPYNYQSEPPRMDRVTPTYSAHGYAPPPSGNNAVEVTIVAGTNTGIGNWSFFPRVSSDGLSRDGSNPTEMYLEYYMRLGSTWSNRTQTSGKLPGISGDFNKGAKGNQFDPNGMNGWSARSEWFAPCPSDLQTSFGSYLYFVEADGYTPAVTSSNNPGRGFGWDTMGCGEPNVLLENVWYKIKVYCKANSGENRNGIIRGWLNDTQRGERDAVMWTKNSSYMAIDRAWMNVYHGGGALAVPNNDMHVYFADIRIWTP
jgi:hypothetical protein